MSQKKILLVEDEKGVREPLATLLAREGYEVLKAETVKEAETQISESPDLVLLDWMLPDGQGIECLKKWRARGIRVPVIMITARTDVIDRVLGLELGAQDYVLKPFEPRELLARVRVHFRDAAPVVDASGVSHSGIEMNLQNRTVKFRGKELEMTKTEFELLKVFIEAPGQAFSRENLLEKVWGYQNAPTTRTIDTHVLQLRQKTEAHFFVTVHGIGYRFVGDQKD